MNTVQYIGEHLLAGQLGYFLTILSLVASLVATFAFAKAFYAQEISVEKQWNSSRVIVICFAITSLYFNKINF